jgi:hypothetical protein
MQDDVFYKECGLAPKFPRDCLETQFNRARALQLSCQSQLSQIHFGYFIAERVRKELALE